MEAFQSRRLLRIFAVLMECCHVEADHRRSCREAKHKNVKRQNRQITSSRLRSSVPVLNILPKRLRALLPIFFVFSFLVSTLPAALFFAAASPAIRAKISSIAEKSRISQSNVIQMLSVNNLSV